MTRHLTRTDGAHPPEGFEARRVERVEVLVVGAGLTGLAHAWRQVRKGRDVVVLDSANRAGGTIRTLDEEGCRIEAGPGFVLGPAPHLRALLETLPSPPRLLGPMPLLPWGRSGIERAPRRQVLGGRIARVARGLADHWQRRHASVCPSASREWIGASEVHTLAGGMETLPQTIAAHMGDRLRLGTRVVELRVHGRGRGDGVTAIDAEGRTWKTDEMALALPAAEQRRLLASLVPHHAEVLGALHTVPAVHAAVSLSAATASPELRPAGGFVRDARTRGHVALGVFASALDPPRAPPGHLLVQVAFDAAREASIAAWDETTLARVVRADLGRALRQRIGEENGRVYGRVFVRTDVPLWCRGRLARMHADLGDAGIRLLGDHVLGGTIDRRCVAGAPLPRPVPDGVEVL